MARFLYLYLLCTFLCLSLASADVVIFNNGERWEGLVQEKKGAEDYVVLVDSRGEVQIPRARIARIDTEEKWISLRRIGDQYFNASDYQNALLRYQEALDLSPDNAELQQKISNSQQKIRELSQKETAQRQRELDQLLVEAGTLLQQEKFEDALALIQKVEASMPSQQQQVALRDLKVALYYQWGEYRLDHLDPNGAAAFFELVLELSPNHPEASARLLELWENDPSKTDQLIAIYRQKVKENPQDDNARLKLADLLFSKEDYESALPLYLDLHRAGKLPSVLYPERVKRILQSLHRQNAERGDFAQARHYYKMLLDLFPSTDPLPLALYEYAEERGKRNLNDPEERIALAKFALERGLLSQAKDEFGEALRLQPENTEALEGMKQFATQDLQEAQGFFQSGQYQAAINLAEDIVREYSMLKDILEQADDLASRSRNELQKQTRLRQAEAQELALQGDTYFAQAEGYINAMKSTERDSNVFVVNDRQEAIKYLRRAVIAWEQALRLDPSLAEMAKGDYRTKLQDARQRLYTLENPVPLDFAVPRRAPQSRTAPRP